MLFFLREQPRPFQMIFLLEIWERFGFYTVQGILTLYFIRFLGFSDTQAYYTFGAFSALVFGMIALGGYLGDKVLGTKRTIVLGLVILALGYLALSLAQQETVFWALGLVCVGSGIFKANPSSLLSKCYEEGDPRLHAGFTYYYMAVNLGSVVALLVGPAVAAHFGYSYAYFLSFIGLLLGLVNYWFQRALVRDVNNEADQRPVSARLWLLIAVGVVALTCAARYLLHHVLEVTLLVWVVVAITLCIYVYLMHRENRATRLRMIVALVLMLEAVGFFILYQQMPTSLTLFAVSNVRHSLFGFNFDPQSFQALNPFWIIVLSPLLAKFYGELQRKNIKFSITYKFATGMLCCGLSFFMLYFSRFLYDDAGLIAAWWLVVSYCLQSIGELLVSALGVAMVAELVPASISGFVMGMWFLTAAVSGFLGAKVASFTAMPVNVHAGVESLFIYSQVFGRIGVVTLVIGLVMWGVAKPLNYFIEQ